MLHADGIGKPEAATLEGTRKSKPRIPISQVDAMLNIDAGSRVGRSKAPAVISVGSLEAQDASAEVRVSRPNPSGLAFCGACRVSVETGCQRPTDGTADRKSGY